VNEQFLILDCNYLAHRAKYVFGDLSHKGSATGVVYGFLKDILNLMKRFDTQSLVFCWDSKERKRRKILPEYKMKRREKELNRQEEIFEKMFYTQIEKLRKQYLPTIGFNNVFRQAGYESDDLIAAICKSLDSQECIIISADQDLFQLIRPNVKWYNPRSHTLVTLQNFKKEFKIHPKQWVKVKAIAGCISDNVPGIKGVGEKTAIKYIRSELDKSSKAYKTIKNGWKDIVLRNRLLVELPFKGTKTPKLQADNLSQNGWDEVTKTLGMKSIRFRSII